MARPGQTLQNKTREQTLQKMFLVELLVACYFLGSGCKRAVRTQPLIRGESLTGRTLAHHSVRSHLQKCPRGRVAHTLGIDTIVTTTSLFLSGMKREDGTRMNNWEHEGCLPVTIASHILLQVSIVAEL